MRERFETTRLILRPWLSEDASALYAYAKDERVGPSAGWPVHTSVENSREIIEQVLSADGTYAVVLKESGMPIGSVGLLVGKNSNFDLPETEAEVGYWLGAPYWGQGLIPEAVHILVSYAFEELHMDKLWCGNFEGNTNSEKVQKKCGFVYHHTNENALWELTGEVRTEHVSRFTKDMWEAWKEKR